MRSKRNQILVFIGLIGIFFSCSEKKVEESNVSVCLTDSMMQIIELDTVKVKDVSTELTISGKVSANEDELVQVYPLVGGYVQNLRVELGDYVTKGQTMAVVQSMEVADFQNQYITAESNMNISQKNLQVTSDMYEGGLASERDLVTAKKELEKAQSELKRIKEVLSIYGVGEERSSYTVKAPISGFIIEKNIFENTQFRMDNTSRLFTITNLDKVWVLGNVFESDIDQINVGDKVKVVTLAYPDKEYCGKIDKIFNVLDPDSRVMKVRIVLENPEFLLKPEMFATVSVNVKDDNKHLVLPPDCIVFNNNKEYVLVYKDKCHIEIREIQRVGTEDVNIRISSGVTSGEVVISKHQLLIFNLLVNN
jgi:cobalt-zinc-cadmium efflux system membrane fusion protein